MNLQKQLDNTHIGATLVTKRKISDLRRDDGCDHPFVPEAIGIALEDGLLSLREGNPGLLGVAPQLLTCELKGPRDPLCEACSGLVHGRGVRLSNRRHSRPARVPSDGRHIVENAAPRSGMRCRGIGRAHVDGGRRRPLSPRGLGYSFRSTDRWEAALRCTPQGVRAADLA